MTVTAKTGPIIAFGQSTGGTDSNSERGPSAFFAGIGIMDHRPTYAYKPGQAPGAIIGGWNAVSRITTLNAIPMTKSATIIAGTQHTTSGTALVLASSSVDGLAVVSGGITRADTGVKTPSVLKLDPLVASVTANITNGSNIMTVTAVGAGGGHCYNQLCLGMALTDATTAGNLPTGVTIIGMVSNAGQVGMTGGGLLGTYLLSANATATATGDTITGLYTGAPATVPFGESGSIQWWNPGDMSSRTLLYTCSSASGTGGTLTANGFDVYGYPISETVTIAPASAVTIAGLKAFKFIQSIVPAFTDGTFNYSVGTNDVVGLPVRSDAYQVGAEYDVTLMWNNATIASATGYIAAILTTPTATTGDVRGTYLLPTAASNGTLRLIATQTPLIPNLATSIGLFGQTNFASF